MSVLTKFCQIFSSKLTMRKPEESNSSRVYSTAQGDLRRPAARKSADRGSNTVTAPADGHVRLRRETKGRGGKTVTTIWGLPLTGSDLQDLARVLKRRCGTGGTIKDGTIEIQGDHRNVLQAELEKRGFKVKLAGG